MTEPINLVENMIKHFKKMLQPENTAYNTGWNEAYKTIVDVLEEHPEKTFRPMLIGEFLARVKDCFILPYNFKFYIGVMAATSCIIDYLIHEKFLGEVK